jgi:hypothetical protein
MVASADLENRIQELTKAVSAASEVAQAQGRPLITPWRPDSTASFLTRLGEGDEGCGCGPID